MENLIIEPFLRHYGLNSTDFPVLNFVQKTNELSFEIEDISTNKELVVHTTPNAGMARFSNADKMVVYILNYDKFLSATPFSVQEGIGRCDAILYTADKTHFLFAEIKDRNPDSKNFRKKARKQLIASLTLISGITVIGVDLNHFTNKRCGIFNKQSNSPSPINAVSAFNRISRLTTSGMKRSDTIIEQLGFELWIFMGNQTYPF
ncbi:MAG: hypothetical protein ACK5Z2_15650 [Bacteroidota bacterium]|jgi:hypothetical protein